MIGTIRSFDEAMRDDIHERVTYLAEAITKSARVPTATCASPRTTRSR